MQRTYSAECPLAVRCLACMQAHSVKGRLLQTARFKLTIVHPNNEARSISKSKQDQATDAAD